MTADLTRSVPFTVIGGYLGAGKTTLINHLLKHADAARLGLIVNDFGAINIDADLIESADDRKISLTNGCVCCGLSSGIEDALDEILATGPDHILLEASGVADVAVLTRYGYLQGLRPNGLIVLADAETVRRKADDKYVAQSVRRQFKAADLIILNKIDLVEGDLDALAEWLRDLAPQASVVPTSRCNLPVELVLGARTESEISKPTVSDDPDHRHASYISWSYETGQVTTLGNLQAFLDALPFQVLRLKGYVCLNDGTRKLVQRVGVRTQIIDAGASAGQTTRLVALGLQAQIKPSDLDRLAHKYLKDEPCSI
ncbi:MAG: GTP-binding protein [Proteobacteria bacterium]|nr:GTP-binding protein [Pseudomonadota bacterium]